MKISWLPTRTDCFIIWHRSCYRGIVRPRQVFHSAHPARHSKSQPKTHATHNPPLPKFPAIFLAFSVRFCYTTRARKREGCIMLMGDIKLASLKLNAPPPTSAQTLRAIPRQATLQPRRATKTHTAPQSARASAKRTHRVKPSLQEPPPR